MHKFLTSLLLAGCLLGSCAAPVSAQEKKEESTVARDNSTLTIPYVLAAIGLILVMVLVCMPARRD
jgi:hypothetical protein